ncbi:MAG: nucleotidyl transferase AbiEii/AbiGii toxin family protein [Candidatus Kerfeldbacteria bacterium]|nr:nucleotidyl transferase AbiEii/AbiGii toxin family protein [Candidatus Kerfeldbacteria bacterium]
MDLREIAAEKIRAMNDRVRYRDFYDFTMICLKLNIDFDEVIELVKQKEVRKPISPKNIMSNWKLATQDKQNEIFAIHYSEPLEDDEITEQLQQLQFEEIVKH